MLSKCLKARIASQRAQIGVTMALPFLAENVNRHQKLLKFCVESR